MPSSPGPGPALAPAAPSLPTDEQPNLRWNPFIFIPVSVVCMVIALVSAYRILKGILLAINGRDLTINRIQVRRLTDGNFEDSPMQFQSPGLNSFIMHSLPVSQFTKTIEEEKGSTYHECAVCLGEFEEGEWLKHLPNCTHVFHIACIDTWFQAHSSCPLCRSLVYDLSPCAGFSPDMDIFLQTLSREEYYQERATYLQILRADILRQVAARREERHGGLVSLSPTQLSVENSV